MWKHVIVSKGFVKHKNLDADFLSGSATFLGDAHRLWTSPLLYAACIFPFWDECHHFQPRQRKSHQPTITIDMLDRSFVNLFPLQMTIRSTKPILRAKFSYERWASPVKGSSAWICEGKSAKQLCLRSRLSLWNSSSGSLIITKSLLWFPPLKIALWLRLRNSAEFPKSF